MDQDRSNFLLLLPPIVIIFKLKNNKETKGFPEKTGGEAQGIFWAASVISSRISDGFLPFDSRSAKDLKAKYELENESRRKKRRFEEYKFAENNVIKMLVHSHPGRESWNKLSREAIRIFISLY